MVKLAARSWGEKGRPLAVLLHGVNRSSRSWWRVGPWFGDNGWRAVAVDLRGHGASPRMSGDEGLEQLTQDVFETVLGHGGSHERIDVMLGHSLGALIVLKALELRGDLVSRAVLEDPPGSESTNLGGVANKVEVSGALARTYPEETKRRQLANNPSWTEEDALGEVLSFRDCDTERVADMFRSRLRYDFLGMLQAIKVPTLLILADQKLGSPLIGDERTNSVRALQNGKARVFPTGHFVHREAFEGYTSLLASWLKGPGDSEQADRAMQTQRGG